MSGSSLDGLDVSLIQFDKDIKWNQLHVNHIAYSQVWEKKLKNYASMSAIEYIAFKAQYSIYIGQLLSDYIKTIFIDIDFISFHGHTIMHLPQQGITEQIGNGGTIAAITNIPTITDFRVQDVALGGTGTPLAPLVEKTLFNGFDYYLNLGGIANITHITHNNIVAYDVCPCNQVLNFFSLKLGKPYDQDGLLARKGNYVDEIPLILNKIPFFCDPPPKSIDNNWIQTDIIPKFIKFSPVDVLHTFCNWIADCISSQVSDTNEPTTLLATGGGAHNIYFIELLTKKLKTKNCSLIKPDKDIIDYKEAILMALLGKYYIEGIPNVLSDVTNSSRDNIGGALYKI